MFAGKQLPNLITRTIVIVGCVRKCLERHLLQAARIHLMQLVGQTEYLATFNHPTTQKEYSVLTVVVVLPGNGVMTRYLYLRVPLINQNVFGQAHTYLLKIRFRG
jgi:hypothetical protein